MKRTVPSVLRLARSGSCGEAFDTLEAQQMPRRTVRTPAERLAKTLAIARARGTVEHVAMVVHGMTGRQRAAALEALYLPERRAFEALTARWAEKRGQARRRAHAAHEAHVAFERERQALIAQDAASVETARRSTASLKDLLRAGLSAEDAAAAADWRRGALTIGKLADELGVPKSRLEAWVKAGVIEPSYHIRTRIAGAGDVNMRLWALEDVARIKARLTEIDWVAEAKKAQAGQSRARKALLRDGAGPTIIPLNGG
jgi:hypothetical protein